MKEKILIGLVLFFAFLAIYFFHSQKEIIVNLKPVGSHLYDWRLEPLK